jgi:hypothetical protein
LIPCLLFAQNRYDVVISEIMADPAPSVGLPATEWIELKNTSAVPFSLLNWRVGDATSQSGPLPNFVLRPDSFVIVCSSTAAIALSVFGTTVSVTSFPSLDNEGDQLYIKAANGAIIHAVNYTSAWYQNEVKKDGGWTLEMTDTKNPCAGITNWKASTGAAGGTPGKKNSTDGVVNDDRAPLLKRAYTTDQSTIILVYDEPVDSLTAATINNYTADGGLLIQQAVTLSPLFTEVKLKTAPPMTAGTIYTIKATAIKDCAGNTAAYSGEARTGLPADPVPGDWIINEILFNPRTNGDDYAEFYNTSHKILDASRLFIANRNSTGVISGIKPLSAVPYYIFPGEYIVATANAASLAREYFLKNPAAVLEVNAPPSFPDEEGTVVALNFQGTVTDEVHYKDDWHFKLLDNQEGVSLERIDPPGPSQDEHNWHSAASTAGYGTPGYKNSQYKMLNAVNAAITVLPKVFSPDNDGRDDIATIQYSTTAPGFVANITLFDAAGRPVRYLVQNSILGLNGYWTWDGLDEAGNKLPIGTYIVLTELFNLQGKKEKFKTAIVLGRFLK